MLKSGTALQSDIAVHGNCQRGPAWSSLGDDKERGRQGAEQDFSCRIRSRSGMTIPNRAAPGRQAQRAEAERRFMA